MSVLALVASAAAYEYDSFTSLGIKIPVALLSCILSILLIVAVKYEKPILLIPFLIWQVGD